MSLGAGDEARHPLDLLPFLASSASAAPQQDSKGKEDGRAAAAPKDTSKLEVQSRRVDCQPTVLGTEALPKPCMCVELMQAHLNGSRD
jgi:hypothetical protein